MAEATSTPGPWFTGVGRTRWSVFARIQDDVKIICVTACNARERADAENQANAVLISAAPSMALELEAILAEAESHHEACHGDIGVRVAQCDSICALIPSMRAALVKAGRR